MLLRLTTEPDLYDNTMFFSSLSHAAISHHKRLSVPLTGAVCHKDTVGIVEESLLPQVKQKKRRFSFIVFLLGENEQMENPEPSVSFFVFLP